MIALSKAKILGLVAWSLLHVFRQLPYDDMEVAVSL